MRCRCLWRQPLGLAQRPPPGAQSCAPGLRGGRWARPRLSVRPWTKALSLTRPCIYNLTLATLGFTLPLRFNKTNGFCCCRRARSCVSGIGLTKTNVYMYCINESSCDVPHPAHPHGTAQGRYAACETRAALARANIVNLYTGSASCWAKRRVSDFSPFQEQQRP